MQMENPKVCKLRLTYWTWWKYSGFQIMYTCILLLFSLSTTEENRGLGRSFWSPCSPSCGFGIQWKIRNGVQAWKVCVLPPCPVVLQDWRDDQCRSHQNILNAEIMSEYSLWESSDNHHSACHLDCKPVGQSHTVHRLNSSVMDGRRCGEGQLKICLQGVCEVNKNYD